MSVERLYTGFLEVSRFLEKISEEGDIADQLEIVAHVVSLLEMGREYRGFVTRP